MLDKKDAQWWLLEAQQHPDTVPDLIRMLAERLAFLDRQNEELRGEVITLRRNQHSEGANGEVTSLQQRVRELENALRRGGSERRALIYQPGQITANVAFDSVQKDGFGAAFAPGAALLIAEATAKLLAITADSRAYNIGLADLPLPETNSPALIENPPHLTVLLDQAVLERCRYLTLVSRRGFIYSVIAGTVNRLAARHEPLLRNLIPDDPIIAAVPSNNTDLIAISRQARFTRFPERAINATGSPALELPKGDALSGVAWFDTDMQAIFLSTSGGVFVRRASDLPSRTAPGKSIGLLCRGQTMLGVAAGTPNNDLFVLTQRGALLVIRVDDLPYRAQSEDGAPLPGLAANDSIAAFCVR